MNYKDCKVLCNIRKKDTPLVSVVPVDEFTKMVQNNFDYEFTGESEFYPYELPVEVKELLGQVNMIAIVGASGSGKSTLLKEFDFYGKPMLQYDGRAIVSNFSSPEDASRRLSSVGLNSMPVWCRPRNVLSIGEGFRSDLALNICSNTIFDEFTSTIDRTVAMSTCNSIKKFILDNDYRNVVFCSCHNDYIDYLCPSIVIDLDEEKVFDCRGYHLGKALNYKSTVPQTKINGTYLGSIII